MVRTLTGSRIRKARKSDGWTQTALASAAGISPSYLNLIEHNRRAATGDVLTALASALGTTTETLSRDGDSQLISTLHEAAARLPDLTLSPGTLEDLASRNPEMAELLASTFQRLREVEGTVTALSDRLTHDPYLSENVHGMLSTITAIRSSASILHQMHDLTPEQDNRFRRSVHEESLRLSSVAEGLAEYLSRSGVDPEKALTPEETLDRFLTRRNWVFDALDQEAATLADIPRAIARSRLSEVISEMLGDTDDLGPAQTMARDWLDQYASDALTMPLRPFHQSAKDTAWDPPTLARTYQTDLQHEKPLSHLKQRLDHILAL